MENALYLLQVSGCITGLLCLVPHLLQKFNFLQSQQNLFSSRPSIFVYYSCFRFFKGSCRLPFAVNRFS